MTLTPGNRLGPYEITEQIGIGGMGEVYRARDVNLGRDVAIKVLPEAFAQDADRLARFEREAKTLASLSHPNIAIVHGFEKTGDVRALVMELVEGPTLADLIEGDRRRGESLDSPVAGGSKDPPPRRSIPTDEAVSIARQIAEALEAAHEQGIVHRDLKPANVKVRDDGTIKVLDFGLAKVYGPPEGGPYVPDVGAGFSRPTASMSPTITTPAMTQIGVILGTAAYMAPEQARGKPVDKRSDIWAFGCVLFEMLAGTRAFDGEDATDTIAAVVRAEPRWDALPADVPSHIRLLLRRCLEKDRKKRIADMSTALFIMSEHAVVPAPAAALTPAQPRPMWRQIAGYAAAVAVASALTGAVVWMLMRSDPPRVTRLELTTSGTSALALFANNPHLAITRDGSRVIYQGSPVGLIPNLFARRLDQLESTLLAERATQPFVSPDGEWVGFFQNESLRKVAITGGPSIELAKLEGGPRGAAWGPDGTIVFATNRPDTGLFRVSADGGTPVVLTRPDKGFDHWRPTFLPGGRAVMFTIAPDSPDQRANSRIAVLDLQSAANNPKIVFRGGSDARYLPTGHLVYVADNSLRAVRFDLERLEVRGSAVPVAAAVNVIGALAGDFDVSDDGMLVYIAQTAGIAAERTLTWVDRQGKEEPIVAPPRAYLYPRISPDGTRLALDVRDQELDIWVWDLVRRNATRVTKDSALDRAPVWSADGQFVFFSSTRDGAPNIFRQRADGTGGAERLTENSLAQHPSSLSPDGTLLLFQQNPAADNDVMALRLDTSTRPVTAASSPRSNPQSAATDPNVRPLVKTPDAESNGVISPDGRWLAYQSNESGNWDVYVRPMRDLERGARFTVSTGGGTQPRWARNGRELFYLSPQSEMMGVQVGNGDTWSPAAPVKLFDASGFYTGGTANPYDNYDVAKDGRFLMIKPKGTAGEGAPSTNLIVVQNWFEELKRLVPVK